MEFFGVIDANPLLLLQPMIINIHLSLRAYYFTYHTFSWSEVRNCKIVVLFCRMCVFPGQVRSKSYTRAQGQKGKTKSWVKFRMRNQEEQKNE